MDITYVNEKSGIDISEIKLLLNNSYWAKDRSLEDIEKSIKYSDCICAYDNNQLVGFARIVTDYTTFFWLCDVIIEPDYRGMGIGKGIMDFITKLDYYTKSRGALATKDAFSLYEKYSFKKDPIEIMSKNRGD